MIPTHLLWTFHWIRFPLFQHCSKSPFPHLGDGRNETYVSRLVIPETLKWALVRLENECLSLILVHHWGQYCKLSAIFESCTLPHLRKHVPLSSLATKPQYRSNLVMPIAKASLTEELACIIKMATHHIRHQTAKDKSKQERRKRDGYQVGKNKCMNTGKPAHGVLCLFECHLTNHSRNTSCTLMVPKSRSADLQFYCKAPSTFQSQDEETTP